jgi:uncharacterized ParB-like nuclease family protein
MSLAVHPAFLEADWNKVQAVLAAMHGGMVAQKTCGGDRLR